MHNFTTIIRLRHTTEAMISLRLLLNTRAAPTHFTTILGSWVLAPAKKSVTSDDPLLLSHSPLPASSTSSSSIYTHGVGGWEVGWGGACVCMCMCVCWLKGWDSMVNVPCILQLQPITWVILNHSKKNWVFKLLITDKLRHCFNSHRIIYIATSSL